MFLPGRIRCYLLLTTSVMPCVQLVSGLESRLGKFEARVDGSISELQAKVTLIEGRLKFVERASVAERVSSASVLSAASAPASPMKEPDTTYVCSAQFNFACLFAHRSYIGACVCGTPAKVIVAICVIKCLVQGCTNR